MNRQDISEALCAKYRDPPNAILFQVPTINIFYLHNSKDGKLRHALLVDTLEKEIIPHKQIEFILECRDVSLEGLTPEQSITRIVLQGYNGYRSKIGDTLHLNYQALNKLTNKLEGVTCKILDSIERRTNKKPVALMSNYRTDTLEEIMN